MVVRFFLSGDALMVVRFFLSAAALAAMRTPPATSARPALRSGDESEGASPAPRAGPGAGAPGRVGRGGAVTSPRHCKGRADCPGVTKSTCATAKAQDNATPQAATTLRGVIATGTRGSPSPE